MPAPAPVSKILSKVQKRSTSTLRHSASQVHSLYNKKQRGSRSTKVCSIEKHRITGLELCSENLQQQISTDLKRIREIKASIECEKACR